jgi:hypothetical protein
VLDDITKEELAAVSPDEPPEIEDALELHENGIAVRFRDWDRIARRA